MRTPTIYLHSAKDACAWYRSFGPWSAYRKQFDLQMIPPGESGWWTAKQADIFFMMRPYEPLDVEIAQMAKECGSKVWLDYDDDIFNVAPDHGMYTFFHEPKRIQAMKDCLALADCVTVSTKSIKKTLAEHTKAPIHIVPNAFDNTLFQFPYTRPKNDESKDCLLWRGGPNYNADLLRYVPTLSKFLETREDLKLVIFGTYHWHFLTQLSARCLWLKEANFPVYMRQMAELAPPVHVKLMVDNTFNRGKSDCSWLEASYAGAVTIGPDFGDADMWQGCYQYNSEEELMDRLERATRRNNDNDFMWNCAAKYIRKDRFITEVNKQRHEILKGLVYGIK